MSFIVKIKNRYYFNRRVPEEVKPYDPRSLIRISLKTDSKEQAQRKAIILNDQVEAYWQELINTKTPYEDGSFRKVVLIARQMGFIYQPMSVVATLPIAQLLERILVLDNAKPSQVEALLGGKETPETSVKKALELFWKLSKDKVMNKSELQIRKWKNPRKRAIQNFIQVIGNKPLKQVTREDIVTFRDWWINRIENEGMNADSANKNFIQIKNIFETVSDHEKLGLDIQHLFKKIVFKTHFKQTRLPFTNEQIRCILESSALLKTSEEARWFLFAAAETGARPSEIIGLLPEDIVLNADIPHISIRSGKDRMLKTPHSERVIPLVGYALEAFRAMPEGFPKYRDKPDHMTNAVNKFLRENNLFPTGKHTVYSFRHSFQDRILSVNAPDRVQAELMGHKFQRPKYGNGASLEQKLEWLQKIQLL